MNLPGVHLLVFLFLTGLSSHLKSKKKKNLKGGQFPLAHSWALLPSVISITTNRKLTLNACVQCFGKMIIFTKWMKPQRKPVKDPRLPSLFIVGHSCQEGTECLLTKKCPQLALKKLNQLGFRKQTFSFVFGNTPLFKATINNKFKPQRIATIKVGPSEKIAVDMPRRNSCQSFAHYADL